MPPRKILKIDALRLNLVAFLTLQYNVQLYMISLYLRHLGMTWKIESFTNHIHDSITIDIRLTGIGNFSFSHLHPHL